MAWEVRCGWGLRRTFWCGVSRGLEGFPWKERTLKIGFIDYYLDEWHANNYPEMLRKASGGEMEAAYAYGMIPSPLTGRTSAEWCEKYGIVLCETIGEVIEKSDALIVLSPDNCEMHEELSQLPLRSGKRTYIDKTFAPDKRTAEAIFALGEAHGTPCYSTSALRFATEYEALQGKAVKAMSTWGPNDLETYGIHQLEPIVMLMQGRVARVMAVGTGAWVNLLMEWEDGRSASLLCTGGDSPFAANLCLEEGCRALTVESDFFGGFMKNLVAFFRTGEIPVSHSETIAIMALREAALKAMGQPGIWVEVE